MTAPYTPDNPFARPDFSDVEAGASGAPSAPAERPGLARRVGTAFRELGSELVHHPVRTITQPIVRGAEALGQAVFAPVEGERAPVAAKIGYGPAVGLPRPGTIITRKNTPVAITPEQQRQAQVETLANALAAATIAPARAALAPALGRRAASAVVGGAGGAAVGAASTPHDRAVGAVVGGALGGALDAVTPGPRRAPARRPNFDDAPSPDLEPVAGDPPPGPPPSAVDLATALEGGPPPAPRGRPSAFRGPGFEPVVTPPEGLSAYSPDNPFAPTAPASDVGAPRARPRLPAVAGRDDVVTLADGTKYPVQYQVVEAADLVPSHRADDLQPHGEYPAGVQGRHYERNPDAQLEVMTRAQQLDPDKLLRDTGSAQGTPIVTPGGIALAGNQRTMMLQRAAALHPERMTAYRQALAQRAQRFGIDPAAIEGMTAPVLVRRIDRIPDTDVAAMRRFNAASDVSEEKAHSALDEGAVRAERLAETPAAVAHLTETLEPGQTVAGYLDTAAGRGFISALVRGGVIQSHELARFQDVQTGRLTPAGKSMVLRTLQQTALGDPDVLARAPAGVVQKLDHALPSLLRVAGGRFAMARDLAEAVDMLTTLQSHKDAGHGIGSIADLVGQGDLLGGNDRVGKAQVLAEFIEAHSQRDVTEAFRKYGQLASEALAREASQGDDIFGTTPLTPDQAFVRAFAPDEEPRGMVAETPAGYATRAHAERIANDPKEIFLAKHGRPSVAYLEARKYLGTGDALSADDVRLEAATRSPEERRDLFAPGQEEMFGHQPPASKPTGRPSTGDATLDLLRDAEDEARGGEVRGGEVRGGEVRDFGPVYHGSPHRFDKFSMEKTGTGEGGQAYGHGIYFADRKGTAASHRNQLTDGETVVSLDGAPALPYQRLLESPSLDEFEQHVLGNIWRDGDLRKHGLASALRGAEAWYRDRPKARGEEPTTWTRGMEAAAKRLQGRVVETRPGALYHAEINANPDELLDWDQPLGEQSATVQAALRQLGFRHDPDALADAVRHTNAAAARFQDAERAVVTLNRNIDEARATGRSAEADALEAGRPRAAAALEDARAAYRDAGLAAHRLQLTATGRGRDLYGAVSDDPRTAAAALRAAGIKGLRYLDGGSRGAGQGTHNYVVFDDALIRVLRVEEQRAQRYAPASRAGDIDDAGAVGAAGRGRGLLLERAGADRPAGAAEGSARLVAGRGAAPVPAAAAFDRGEGAGGRASARAYADAVASKVAERDSHDPAQRNLFSLVHGAAEDVAAAAQSLPATPVRGFPKHVPGLRTAEPYSRQLLAELKREQAVRPLVGQVLRTAQDFGVAAQVLRDPRVESFRVIYLDAQMRVAHAEVSGARLSQSAPSSASVFLKAGRAATFRHIRTTAMQTDAVYVVLQHNHPSGRPIPSFDDMEITRQFARELRQANGPKVLGHLIIDHDTFSWHRADGMESTLTLPLDARRPLAESAVSRVLAGDRISAERVKQLAVTTKALQQDPTSVMLFHVDVQGVVTGVQEVAPTTISAAALKRWGRAMRSSYVFAVAPSEAVGRDLRRYPLTDILTADPHTYLERGLPPTADFDLEPAFPTRFHRVREDEAGYHAEPMPPDVAAAYRRRQAGIDFSGALTTAAERAHTGLLSSRIQRLGDAIANDKGPIERLGTFAERADPDFRPTENPKYLLSYAKESAATVHRAITEGVPDPITRETIGPSYEDLFRPFGRDDALIRQALTYAVEKRGTGRGIEAYGGDAHALADAQAVVRHLDHDPRMTAFADRLTRYDDALRRYAVRSGLWTAEQAEDMRQSDLLYIPYRRILDALAKEGSRRGVTPARGLANVTSGVKSFVGSRRALSNPALALAEYTDAVIRRADAYRVGHALFSAADRLGDYGKALLTPVAAPDVPARAKALAGLQAKAMASADPRLRAMVGQLGDLFSPAVDPRHPVIWRNEPDGSRRYAIVNAPDLYRAVAGMAAPASVVQRFLDLTLLPVRRVFTAATTAFVPRFAGGTNPARDIVDAFAKTQHGVTPLDLARGYLDALGEVVGADKVAAHLPALQRAFDAVGVQLDQLPALSDRAARAKRHGLGGVSMFGAATRPKQVARRYAPTTPAQRVTGAIGRYTGGDRSPLVAVERVFSASDLGPRLGEAAAAARNPLVLGRLRRGVWDAADVELYAATAGRVLTLDFSNQPGDPVVRVFGRYVPFARPALQSPVRYAEAFARNPKRMTAFVAGLSAAAIGAWVLKHRSATALEKTNDRPDGERAGFLLYPLDDDARVTLRLPLGQEAAVVTSATTALLDAWLDEDPEAAGTFTEAVLRSLPPGVDQWVQGNPEVPIPLLQQIQENDRNRRFFGGAPIEPERLQDVAPEERRYETTPATYSLLARLTGSSPLKLRNLARGVLSQSEPLVSRGTDVLADALMGEAAPVVVRQPTRSSPFNPLSAFVATDPPYRTRSEDQYYALKDRYATAVADAKAALKTRDRSAVARMAGRGELGELADPRSATIFGQADKALGQLRDLQHQTEAAARAGAEPALTRQRMDQITQLRQQVYREALRQLQGRPAPRGRPAPADAGPVAVAR